MVIHFRPGYIQPSSNDDNYVYLLGLMGQGRLALLGFRQFYDVTGKLLFGARVHIFCNN